MAWLLFAFIAPAVWAMMNHFDKYLISRYCKDKSVGSLIVYSGLIGLPIAILIALFQSNVFSIPPKDIMITILSGAVYLSAMICYLKALERDEASIVAPLMQLSSIISLALGFAVFHEILNQNQLVGAFVILTGSIGLTMGVDGNRKFFFKKKIFLLMFVSSFFLSLNGVLFKFAAVKESFWVNAFWMYVGYTIYTILLMTISRQIRTEFFSDFKGNSIPIISLNIINELLTAVGNLSFNFAILLAPIGLVYFVSEGAQPFFVLLYATLLTKFFPKLGEESMLADHLIQKILAILLMGVGVYLINI